MVTACNPNGVLTSEDLNRVADGQLRSQLEKSGLVHFRVTGGSRDGRHQEPGFGIVTDDREKIRLLSQQLHQEAFFWMEHGVLYCVESGSVTLHRIAPWSERQK